MALPATPKISGYSNSSETQETDFKALFSQLLEGHKEEMNKSLKETEANMAKQVEAQLVAYRQETNKKVEIIIRRQESTFNQMKEMVQGMKTESIKKTQRRPWRT